MSRKLPPKKWFAQKRHKFIHMLVPNHTQRRKRFFYVSHGMYSALHSVYDQTILFTQLEDHGGCSRPRQIDRPSAQGPLYWLQPARRTECKRRLPKSNLVLAQRAIRLVLLFELLPTVQWLQCPTPSQEEGLITCLLITTGTVWLRQNKIHSWFWIFCVRSWLSWSIYIMTKVMV
jgi:hypothetical protein